jgi:hypothetical protein
VALPAPLARLNPGELQCFLSEPGTSPSMARLAKSVVWFVVLVIEGVSLLPASPSEPVYLGKEWVRATPAEMGLDVAKVNQARDYALRGGGSGCIMRSGKLVMLWGDFHQRYDLKSTTKSIGVTALGLAIQDGKMNLSDLASKHHGDDCFSVRKADLILAAQQTIDMKP